MYMFTEAEVSTGFRTAVIKKLQAGQHSFLSVLKKFSMHCPVHDPLRTWSEGGQTRLRHGSERGHTSTSQKNASSPGGREAEGPLR